MSGSSNGPGPEDKQEGRHKDIPRFVVGCEEDEEDDDMDQVEIDMKSDNSREEDMEEDDDSVSHRLKKL